MRRPNSDATVRALAGAGSCAEDLAMALVGRGMEGITSALGECCSGRAVLAVNTLFLFSSCLKQKDVTW